MENQSHYSLTDVPGIGEKTASRIRDHFGTTNPEEVLIRYLTSDGDVVSRLVHNPASLTKILVNNYAFDIDNSSLGFTHTPGRNRVSAMAVIRQERIHVSHRTQESDTHEPLKIPPTHIRWEQGHVTNLEHTYGFAYDFDAATSQDHFPLIKKSTERVTGAAIANDEETLYELTHESGGSTILGKPTLQKIMRHTGIDYLNNLRRIKIHPTENKIILFETGSGCHFFAAPCCQP